MEGLKLVLKDAVKTELSRAAEKFGVLNKNDHESYAIILEEWEEMQDEIENAKYNLEEFWQWSKDNKMYVATERKVQYLKYMREAMYNALAEGIQVIAMLDKAIATEVHNAQPQTFDE